MIVTSYRLALGPLLALPLACAAQVAAHGDRVAHDGASPPPAVSYRSAFDDYRAWTDPRPGSWRAANDEVGRLRGHAGHLEGSAPVPRPGGGAGAGGPPATQPAPSGPARAAPDPGPAK